MSNDRFKFKQFTIHQAGAAMKVGTDGVLLGAWAGLDGAEKRILDIGTGTGLIALMAAQRSPAARLDAVEIDENAVRQAKENVAASPWPERIRIHLYGVQDFAAKTNEKYDHILTNPPFFVSSLKAPDQSRALARHSDTLPFGDLARAVVRMLAPAGRFSVIYPVEEAELFTREAGRSGLYCNRKTRVRSVTDGPVKRILMEFSFREAPVEESELTIESGRHQYTDEYRELTRDFYLKC